MGEKFVYSIDEERYAADEYDTRDDALAAGRSDATDDDREDATIWTAVPMKPTIGTFLRGRFVEYLLDQVVEEAGEECGEFAEDWMVKLPHDIVSDLEVRLGKLLEEWATQWGQQPSFFTVDQVQEHPPEPQTEPAA